MNTEMLESTVDTETVETEVTTEVDLSAFDEGWDDDSAVVEEAEVEAEQETDDSSEANQQEEDGTGAEDNQQAESEEVKADEKAANQVLTVTYNKATKDFDWERDKDEIKTLVQKGMDYDRKTQRLADYEEFLKELAAPQKLNIEQLIDTTRARLFKANEAREGREVSDTDALLAVQKQRAEKAAAKQSEAEAQKQTEKETAEQKNREMLNRFIAAYPEVKGDSIPKSVWEESKKTGDLVAAYAKHEKKQLEEQIAVLRQNKKNAERSIGSVRSTGASKARDAFDEGWDLD